MSPANQRRPWRLASADGTRRSFADRDSAFGQAALSASDRQVIVYDDSRKGTFRDRTVWLFASAGLPMKLTRRALADCGTLEGGLCCEAEPIVLFQPYREGAERPACQVHAPLIEPRSKISELLEPDVYFYAVFEDRPLSAQGRLDIISVAGYSSGRFPDGLIIDPKSCPAGSRRRSHWHPDGSCACPADQK